MKNIFCIAVFTCMYVFTPVLNAQLPAYEWVKQIQGTGTVEINDIKADSAGNVYAAGSFTDSISLNGNVYVSRGGTDAFFAAFDASGNIFWGATAGGLADEAGEGVALDKSGNLYFTGLFTDSIFFDAARLAGIRKADVFLVKYSKTGSRLWQKAIGGLKDERLPRIVVTPANELVLAAITSSDTVQIDTARVYITSQLGGMIVAKFNSSGNLVWTIKASGGGYINLYDLIADGNNNIYLAGAALKNMIFGSFNIGNFFNTEYTAFIAKLSNSATVLWVKGVGNDTGGDKLAVNSRKEIYFAGRFKVGLNIGGFSLQGLSYTYSDIFLIHYDSSGLVLNAFALTGNSAESCNAMTVDTGNNLFMAISTLDYMTINNTIYPANNNDILIAKMNSADSIEWVKMPVGIFYDAPTSVVVNPAGGLYLSAVSNSPIFACPPYYSYNIGLQDAYLIKLNETTLTDIESADLNAENFRLYPNPGNSFLTIAGGEMVDSYKIFITDLNGRLLKSIKSGTTPITFSTEDLEAGMYCVKVYTPDQSSTFKWIKY